MIIEKKTFYLQQCSVELENIGEASTPNQLLQGAFFYEISADCNLIKIWYACIVFWHVIEQFERTVFNKIHQGKDGKNLTTSEAATSTEWVFTNLVPWVSFDLGKLELCVIWIHAPNLLSCWCPQYLASTKYTKTVSKRKQPTWLENYHPT